MTKRQQRDDYQEQMLEEYIETRRNLIKMQERLFWAFVFLGMLGLIFLLILIFVGLRLDAIDFFSNAVG